MNEQPLTLQAPVDLHIADGIATISLNRPHRHNAIDDATHEEFLRVWNAAVADRSSRVIVLRGEGPSFCSGRDMAELGARADGESNLAFVRKHQAARIEELSCPKPVIAALRGYVLGGGLEIALAADIRIAASDVQLAFPEIRYGLMSDTGGSALATILASPSRAKFMLMTGRRIDASRALEWGLVDELVAPSNLDQAATELAASIADKPADALAMIKGVVDGMWQGSLRAAMQAELLAQVALFGGEDYAARKQSRSAPTKADRDAAS
jgi:enoyl-CoA hydratase/carnithine racemase